MVMRDNILKENHCGQERGEKKEDLKKASGVPKPLHWPEGLEMEEKERCRWVGDQWPINELIKEGTDGDSLKTRCLDTLRTYLLDKCFPIFHVDRRDNAYSGA